MATYYWQKRDLSSAVKYCETGISLAVSTGNTKRHCHGLVRLADIMWYFADYSKAQLHASEAQRIARISADLYQEAGAINVLAMCCYMWGDYTQSISLSSRARHLLNLCGLSGSSLDYNIVTTQAETHKFKSEYVEARSIHNGILQETSIHQDPYNHAFALLNIAEIDVSMDAPKHDVQRSYDTARKVFSTQQYQIGLMMCDTILADLYLREGNMPAAKDLFEKCLGLSLSHPEIISYCLERLANASRWGSDHWSGQTMVFLVYSLRLKKKLGIYKALQFLGDIFLAQDDEHTAINLFTVALEGFTWMDVHCSRAECMLRLGDISKGHGDLFKALELWETARPLFERASQTKKTELVDERLASVGEVVLKQHRNNLAHLAKLNTPSGIEVPEGNLSNVEDEEAVLNEVKEPQLIAV
jgi:tetratricopeptide (TPR) repeat protein